MPNIVAVGQISLTDLNDALVADSRPNAPHKGMLWIDSSITPPLLKKWDGADWIVIGEVSTEGTGTIIEDVVETIGNMANDNLIDYNERQVIKDRLTEILGYIITDTASSLPTVATLDGSEKGGFYSVRRSALNAGLKATDSAYSAVATHYNNLKSYLDGLTPIKPWDLRTENQDKNITVTKATFRDRWLQYYLAVDALATATAEKLKQNVDDIEVGGRNFASNGDFSTVLTDARWSEYYHGNVKEIVDISTEKPPFRFALRVANTSNATGGIFTPVIFEGEEANALIDKDITVSYWLKYQNITQGTNTFDIGRFGEIIIEGENASGATVNAYYRLGNSDTFGSSYVSGTDNEWKKYGGTLRIALPSGAVRIKRIRFKHGLESCKGEFWTTGLKIETGNKVTDWTENPLDLQGRLTDVEFKVLPDQIVSTVRSSEKYSEDLQNIEEKVAKLLTLTTSSHIMTFDANDNFSPSSQTITITANTQNIASTPIFTATPYSASGTQLSPITLGGSGNVRTLTSSQWLSNYSRVVIQASWSGYSDTITIVKVKDGARGATGSTGSSGKDAIVGFLTNESITLSANVSGVVSDFSGATGTFEVYEGISRKTGSGVTYARTSQSGCTVSINSTGIYSVTAMSSDTATATFTATYGGVTITKTLSLSKSRVGATGAKGADGKGITSITEEYYLSTSSTTQTGGSWLTEPPAWVNGRYMWTRSTITYTDGSSSTTVPVNTTGARGATGSSGSDGIGITSVDVEYYLSTSSSSLSGGSWSTDAPTWVNGRYMWSRTKTVFTNGITEYSEPACITGAKGETGQKGADGKGVVSATVDYKNHTSGTTAPTGTWSSTVPAPVKGQYLWTRTITTYTDNSTVTTYSVAYNATDGQKGSDGRGISSTTTTYQIGTSGTTAPTGSWVANPPTPIKGRYLWTRVVIEYTDGTSSTSYSTSYYATDGQKGDKGDTGVSVTSIVERYLATSASSGVSTGTSGWTDTIQTMTSTNKYLWNYEIINFSNGSTQTTTPVIIGVYGDRGATGATGATGRSITGITEYYLATNASSGVTRSTSGWTTDMQSTSTSKKYLWNYEMITWSSAPTTTYVEPVIIGVHGDTGAKGADGKGVVNATVTYKNHTSGTTAPTGTWSNTIPTPVKGQYLWTRTVTTYTDNSTVTTYSVAYTPTDGQNGANGKGISSTSIAYQISTSGTTTPTGTWSTTVPTPIKGRYLWTRTIMNYTDGTNSTSYSTSYYATDGQKGDKGEKGDDGISVTKVDVEFYLSTSSTTQTGGSWQTTAPTWVDGRYMWTRTKTTYSNGQTTTSPAVNVTGAKGSTGSTGSAGRSVSAIKEQYYLSTSKTTQTGGSWVDSPPTWVAGRYMWTRVHITYANPSGTATTTPVVDASWEAIDGIQVGGRNLYKGTSEEYKSVTWNNWNNFPQPDLYATGIEPGAEYTASIYYRNITSTAGSIGIRIFWYSDTGSQIKESANGTGLAQGQSGTVVVTDTAPANATKAKIVLRRYTNSGTQSAQYSRVKLEKGNKATDWSPAPEDVEMDSNKKTYLPVRYIRDHANGSSANSSNHWYEIQAYNTKGENVALGKPVTSNTSLSNSQAVTDGSTSGTYANTGSGYNHVRIDLGAVHYGITAIKVWRYHNDGRTYKETKTEVSPDGVTWYPIFDSAVEGTYPETSSGREFPNTYAKAESLLASKSVEVRVASAESRITQTENDITSRVAKTDYTGNTIASLINQSATTVSISASKINLNGAVTFNMFNSDVQSKVNEGVNALDNAKKYVDDNTGNLVKNPAVTGSHTGWSGAGLSSVLRTFEGVSTRVLQSSTGSNVQYYSSWFKVDPAKAYEVSLWISKSASGTYYVGLNGLDASGATVGFVDVNSAGVVSSSNNTNFYFRSGTVGTDWIQVIGYIMPVGTTPSDMKGIGTNSSAILKQNVDRVRVRFLNWNNNGTTRQLWVANPKVVEVDPNAVIRGTRAKELTDAWRYSNTTEINGAHIRTGTLSADKITTGVLRAIDIEGVTITGSTFNARYTGDDPAKQYGYMQLTDTALEFAESSDYGNMYGQYYSFISYSPYGINYLSERGGIGWRTFSLSTTGLSYQGLGAGYEGNFGFTLDTVGFGATLWSDSLTLESTYGNSQGVIIKTPNGIGIVGARNTSYFHMDTDRPWFYMYKPLHINGKVIASDGLESRGALDMTNQNIVNVNRLEFADPGGNEGIEWMGGNGWKIVESPDDASNSSGNLQFFTSGNTRRMTLGVNGRLYLPSGYFYGVGESLLRLSRDTRSDAPHFIISMDTYNRTYSNAPNMYITGNGVIGRTTSASKYKLYIKNIENTLPDKILKLNPKSWFDKASVESYAQYLSKNNGIKNGVENEHLDIDIRRHYGLIAEDLVASGLEMYVQYGEPDENGKREVEGIEYDRLWTLLIPVVKELKQKTEDELNWLKIENQYLKRKIEILEEKV